MTTWTLILVLTNPFGFVSRVERVAPPFPTLEACNAAGVEAHGRQTLTPPSQWERWSGDRIDWVCVPAEPVKACVERRAARERLREEFRKASREAAAATDRALGVSR